MSSSYFRPELKISISDRLYRRFRILYTKYNIHYTTSGHLRARRATTVHSNEPAVRPPDVRRAGAAFEHRRGVKACSSRRT